MSGAATNSAITETKGKIPFGEVFVGHFPASLQRYRWNVDALLREINAKLSMRARHSNCSSQEMFRLFDPQRDPARGAPGVTPQQFQHTVLSKLGIFVNDEELKRLFQRFDPEQGTFMTWNNFVEHVLPDDFPASDSVVRRAPTPPPQPHERRLQELPASLAGHKWNIRDVERQIQLKIAERTRMEGNFQYRNAFRLLERKPGAGINKADFADALRNKFDILVSPAEVDALFEKYDPQGTGRVLIQEFVKKVLPPDYTAAGWVTDSEERAERMRAQQQRDIQSDLGNFHCPETAHFSVRRMHQFVKDKINKHCRTNWDQARWAYKKLENYNEVGISKPTLRRQLKTVFGVALSDAQLDGLFAHYNPSGSGTISLAEFVAAFALEPKRHHHHLEPREEKVRTIVEIARGAPAAATEMSLYGTKAKPAPQVPVRPFSRGSSASGTSSTHLSLLTSMASSRGGGSRASSRAGSRAGSRPGSARSRPGSARGREAARKAALKQARLTAAAAAKSAAARKKAEAEAAVAAAAAAEAEARSAEQAAAAAAAAEQPKPQAKPETDDVDSDIDAVLAEMHAAGAAVAQCDAEEAAADRLLLAKIKQRARARARQRRRRTEDAAKRAAAAAQNAYRAEQRHVQAALAAQRRVNARRRRYRPQSAGACSSCGRSGPAAPTPPPAKIRVNVRRPRPRSRPASAGATPLQTARYEPRFRHAAQRPASARPASAQARPQRPASAAGSVASAAGSAASAASAAPAPRPPSAQRPASARSARPASARSVRPASNNSNNSNNGRPPPRPASACSTRSQSSAVRPYDKVYKSAASVQPARPFVCAQPW